MRCALDPSKKHEGAMIKILEYIKGTRESGLKFWKAGRYRLKVFADASYAEDKEDKRSGSGTVVMSGGSAFS